MPSKNDIRGARVSDQTMIRDEMIEIVVRVVQTLGLPKSLGEIYGLLYASPEPLSMDMIRRELGLSVGSVSQGIRQLRGLNVVRTIYVPGDRRDYFEAETELRQLVSGFLSEILYPEVESMRARLDAIRPNLDSIEDPGGHYRGRWEKMNQWQKTAKRWLKPLTRLVRP